MPATTVPTSPVPKPRSIGPFQTLPSKTSGTSATSSARRLKRLPYPMFKPFLLLGFLAMGFGWWGANSAAGRQRFDEMAGIIPIAAPVLGTVIFAVGPFLFVRR